MDRKKKGQLSKTSELCEGGVNNIIHVDEKIVNGFKGVYHIFFQNPPFYFNPTHTTQFLLLLSRRQFCNKCIMLSSKCNIVM